MDSKFYQPGDDTFTFIQALKNEHEFIAKTNPKIILEIGCGSGIISKFLKTTYKNAIVLSNDINYNALLHTQSTANTDVFKSSLMKNVKQEYIDLLIFNPPYVETPEEDIGFEDIRASYSGGMNGNSVIKQFICELNNLHLFYLLVIKVNKPEMIIELIKAKNYDVKQIQSKKIMGETIYILRAIKM